MDNNFENVELESVVNAPVFCGVSEGANVQAGAMETMIGVVSDTVDAEGSVIADVSEKTEASNIIPNEVKHVVGDIIIPTELLRYMVLQARKIGVADYINPISEIVNIIADENGIVVRASSGVGKQDYECIDRSYSFDKRLAVSLDIVKFSQYISFEKNKEVLLDCVKSEDGRDVLVVQTASGSRKFPQVLDGTTGLPLETKIHLPVNYEDMQPVNYTQFKKLFAVSSSVLGFTKDIKDEHIDSKTFEGMYWGDDIVIVTDGNTMMIQPNDSNFNSKIFFIDRDFCKYLSEIRFNESTFRVGVTEANGDVIGLTFSDGMTTLCGSIALNQGFAKAVEAAKMYWALNGGGIYKIKFKKDDLLFAIKYVTMAIPPIKGFMDKLIFNIAKANMTVKCLDDSAIQSLNIDNPSEYLTSEPICLSASKLDKILSPLKYDDLELIVNKNQSNYVILGCDSFRCVISTMMKDGD